MIAARSTCERQTAWMGRAAGGVGGAERSEDGVRPTLAVSVAIVVLSVAGCSKEEDLGVRLRRECESAFNEFVKLHPSYERSRSEWVATAS